MAEEAKSSKEQKKKAKKKAKEQDKKRAEQVYKQVALHQSDKEILTLNALFRKYAKNSKIYGKKQDDQKEVPIRDLILTHKGLLKVFKYCGIIQLEDDKIKQNKLFKHFDLDEDGTIDYDEVLSNMHAMVSGDDGETLLLLFQLFDHNNDGSLDKQDLKSLFLFQNQVSMIITKRKKQDMKLKNKEINDIVAAMFTSIDKDDSGDIDFDEFKKEMKTRDTNKFLIDEQQKKKVRKCKRLNSSNHQSSRMPCWG
eukprot:535260_1